MGVTIDRRLKFIRLIGINVRALSRVSHWSRIEAIYQFRCKSIVVKAYGTDVHHLLQHCSPIPGRLTPLLTDNKTWKSATLLH